jgi:hypothetical protein
VTCGELLTKAAAYRLADKLTVRLVAPPDHSARDVQNAIAGSLYSTCGQPKLPGVADPADYRPVKPVLAGIQRDFDEEELSGGH